MGEGGKEWDLVGLTRRANGKRMIDKDDTWLGRGGEDEEERGRHLDCDARIVKIDSEGLGRKQQKKPKDRLGQ